MLAGRATESLSGDIYLMSSRGEMGTGVGADVREAFYGGVGDLIEL